jgi:hypothetical protein
MITLVAVLCHTLIKGVPLCVDEVVTTSDFPVMVGKVNDPIPVPGITRRSCESGGGEQILTDWMAQHPIYHVGWWVKTYKCVPGKYVPPQRA